MKRFLLLLLSAGLLSAQDPSTLTLERIFDSDEFFPKFFGPAKWLADGQGYTTLERSDSSVGGRDIVRYDAEKGTRSILVPSYKLVPSGQTKAMAISNYFWSDDGKRLLIFNNTKKVWRYNTRGDYWTLDLGSGKLRKLGGPDAKPSTLMFAKFSPDGKKVAYVRENNLYTEDVETGAVTALTSDGSVTIINGTFDWVYEEEFDCRDGFRWSPDGRSIAFWQMNAEGIGIYYMLNTTDSVYSRPIPVQYPKAGARNSTCRVGVVSADGGAITWMKVEGDSRTDYYIPRMEWADAGTIVFRQLNRLQNSLQVVLGDAKTGGVTTIYKDEDKAWIDVDDEFKVLSGGKGFLVISERDGWRHVYQVSRDGKKITPLTPGNFDVVNVLLADEKENTMYYVASPENPTQRFLYRMKMDGKGKTERLTPAKTGTHKYQIAPGGKWAIHTYSGIDDPAVIDLVSLPKHTVARVLEKNEQLHTQYQLIKRRPVEFFNVNIGGGIVIDGWCMKPPDFDSTKKYPLFIFVYGEPAAQTVNDAWGYDDHLWHLMLAQQGYVVASVDPRGTPAPKGREWRKSIHKKLGLLGPDDHAAAIRKVRRWSFIDSNRVGIWGWSGGGASTLQAMFRYPDVYNVGMCVSPVTDQHNYDNVYTERYMGLPKENAEAYRITAPLTYVHGLQGDLLLVHGTGDDNVHYQNTEMLMNALIAAGKQFSLMAYPNRTHAIYEGEGTTMHLRTLLTDFLKTHLQPGPK